MGCPPKLPFVSYMDAHTIKNMRVIIPRPINYEARFQNVVDFISFRQIPDGYSTKWCKDDE